MVEGVCWPRLRPAGESCVVRHAGSGETELIRDERAFRNPAQGYSHREFLASRQFAALPDIFGRRCAAPAAPGPERKVLHTVHCAA